MQRYDMGGYTFLMVQVDDGEWIRYDDHVAEVERLRDKNRELNRRCQQAESLIVNAEKHVREAELRGAERQAANSKAVHYADRDAQWVRAIRQDLLWDYEHIDNGFIRDCRKRVQQGDE